MSVQSLGATVCAAVLLAHAASTLGAAWIARARSRPVRRACRVACAAHAGFPIIGYGALLWWLRRSLRDETVASSAATAWGVAAGAAFLFAALFLVFVKGRALARSLREGALAAMRMGGGLSEAEVGLAAPVQVSLSLSIIAALQVAAELGAACALAGALARDAGESIDRSLFVGTAAFTAIVALPLTLYLGADAVRRVPSGYAAAAEALGANRWQVFSRIVWPQAWLDARQEFAWVAVRTLSLAVPLLIGAWLAAGEAAS